LPQRPNETGEVLFFHGRVTDPDGAPIDKAEIDVWQADAQGLYSNIHPGIPDWNLRGCFYSSEDGRFELKTILPPPYEIPKNGPTGRVLSALGRHFFRPAHLHVKVRAPGYDDLTSQIYFQGGEYLDSDVANAVREGLVVALNRHDRASDMEAHHVSKPYYDLEYDFALQAKGGHGGSRLDSESAG
jgi:catechol 1,2-dioxygenase